MSVCSRVAYTVLLAALVVAFAVILRRTSQHATPETEREIAPSCTTLTIGELPDGRTVVVQAGVHHVIRMAGAGEFHPLYTYSICE